MFRHFELGIENEVSFDNGPRRVPNYTERKELRWKPGCIVCKKLPRLVDECARDIYIKIIRRYSVALVVRVPQEVSTRF